MCKVFALKRIPILLILPIALLACTTTSGSGERPPSWRQSELQAARSYIESNEPFQAVEILSTLRRTDPNVPASELDSLSQLAASKAVELLKQAVERGDYRTALTLYRSQRLLDPASLSAWSEGELVLDLSEEYRAKGISVPALLTFGRALHTAVKVQAKMLAAYGELALSEGDRAILKQIVDAMTKAKMAVPPSYLTFIHHAPTPIEMSRGVVTVWVNRGIVSQNGVGHPEQIIGSGFFIDTAGHLITNYHVIRTVVSPNVKGYSRLYVRLSTDPNTPIPARVVGFDRAFDIALLKTEVTPGYIFSLPQSDRLQAGMHVYAIGSPGGLENTLTTGIVSATGRRFLQMGNVVQFDAAVNPGNSGGPLFDESGDLLGVVFAGIEQFKGINFAIPAHWVTGLLPALFRGGEVTHPWLGTDLLETEAGLEVIYVVPESPAARADLRVGDIITSLNGIDYTRIADVQQAILSLQAGSLVRLAWKRAGTAMSGLLCLDTRPYLPLETAADRDIPEHLFGPLFGMEVESIGSSLTTASYRVTKVYPGSPAEEADISTGDPLRVYGWTVDKKDGAVIVQFAISRRKQGFLESTMQLVAPLESNDFI